MFFTNKSPDGVSIIRFKYIANYNRPLVYLY